MDITLDADGHLMDASTWTPVLAQTLADTLGLTLTPWHLEVLLAVRDFYTRYQHAPNTRALIKHLKGSDPALDNARLQEAFKTGLVARHLCRLAGLPKPPNCL